MATSGPPAARRSRRGCSNGIAGQRILARVAKAVSRGRRRRSRNSWLIPGGMPDLGGLQAYFQPIVALRTGRLHGFELLARWKHPSRGWVSPEAFIPDAERDGWIDALTWELMRQAFDASARLPHPLALAVNISPLQLRNADLPKQIQEIADAGRFPLECLTIEITESALTHDLAQARVDRAGLEAKGMRARARRFRHGLFEPVAARVASVRQAESRSLLHQRRWRESAAPGRSSPRWSAWGRAWDSRPSPKAWKRRSRPRCCCGSAAISAQGWLYGEPIAARDLDAAAFAALQSRQFPSPFDDLRETVKRAGERIADGSSRAQDAGESAGAAARATAGGLRWRAGRPRLSRREPPLREHQSAARRHERASDRGAPRAAPSAR